MTYNQQPTTNNKAISYKLKAKSSGYITILVLVFAAVFITITSSLAGFIFVQKKLQLTKENREKAIQVAEAGLDYYKWFLSHYPDDLQDGTGVAGPYEHTYSDPEGGDIGAFSLQINGNQVCGSTSSIGITSTGWTNADPTYKRVVFGKYARPSVAEYAYIINSNVWAGSDRVITGRYHSNGGIKMDGNNKSTVSSAVEEWQCSGTFGCSPTQTKPGVFGDGEGSALWEFPVPPIDFEGITVDLSYMKERAQASGIYINPYGGNSDRGGYHLIFKSDGTFDLYRVTSTRYAWSIHIDDIGGGWKRDYHTIDREMFMANYAIPSDCSLIFVESKVWLEGVVKGKVTVAAANVSNPNVDPDIIIQGDIDYTVLDGSDGLTAIAERSVLIPLIAPDDLDLRGIFIAQKGYFGRNLYPCWYSPYDHRTSLETNGTIVSSGRVGTKWGYSGGGCGAGQWSGYLSRENSYDRNLATDPPPLTPYTSDDFRFVEWRED
jgi:hypothetical protein